jgi:hypothetical protein
MKISQVLQILSLVFAGLFSGVFLSAQENDKKAVVEIPPTDIGASTLEARKKEQLQTVDQFKVFHDFTFSDKLVESGITFRHQIVDDAGKHYKPVHYDHGNGIAVADVDGDGLHDVYFVSQLGGNQLWKNLGKGKFQDITEQAGVGLKSSIGSSASFGDYDNDGDQDLFVTSVRKGNVLFQNDGKGRFTDVSKSTGVGYSGHSSGAVFLDYDLDGNLDLFVTNVGTYTTDETGRGGYYVGVTHGFTGHMHANLSETSILYRNTGKNRFVDVSRETGLVDKGWNGDASFADLNQDRFPDLYVLNMQGDDHFWLNEQGKKFVDRTAQFFPKTPWGSMGIQFLDFNNDGLFDLFLTDMHSDMSQEVGPDKEKLKSEMKWSAEMLQGGENNIFGNAFYKNLGNGKFEEISDRIGAENYWPWGASANDLNADGFEDIFIAASMNFPFRYGINTVLLNNKGERFLDSEFILGVEPRRDGRTKTHWFDLDCAAADKGNPLCGNQNVKFSVLANLGTRSSILFDLDQDGDLDIVTNEFNSEPQVLISNLSDKKAIQYLKVQLTGTKSNRNGLGAIVKVYAGDNTYTKLNNGKSGYLSQSIVPLYFGLGEAKAIDRVEVQWPSGVKQIVEKPGINTLLEIKESAE